MANMTVTIPEDKRALIVRALRFAAASMYDAVELVQPLESAHVLINDARYISDLALCINHKPAT